MKSTVARAASGLLRLSFCLAWLAWLAWPPRVEAQGAPTPAASTVLSVEETEDLVRRVDFEGMPSAEAERIGRAGAERLIAMLADPAEAPHHARILLALAGSGQRGALEAIEAWSAGLPSEGAVDRAAFRAWQVYPFALGRLAHHDPRALDALARHFDAAPPGWSFRHHAGLRLRHQAQRAAATALADTGLAEAAATLDALVPRAVDPEVGRHVLRMREALPGAAPR